MADTVRYIAEEMIPELEDFEKRGYFTKAEIKQMVKKRLQFEYLLKRKIPLKADFLRYIEYEERLEALRVHRKAEKDMGSKHTLAEWAIPRRIHFIYDRALRRFKGDLDLWTRWLQHCRAASSPRQMSKVLTRALQLHPREPRLWSHAAGFEFEDHHNPAAARLLLQRGLRICPNSTHLWLENFRLELLYAHQLRTRRQVLGLQAWKPQAPNHPDPLGDAPELAAAMAEDPPEASGLHAAADTEATPSIPASAVPTQLDPMTNGHSFPISSEHTSSIDQLSSSPARTNADADPMHAGASPPEANGSAFIMGSNASPDTITLEVAAPQSSQQQPSPGDNAALQGLLEGAIARVVFRNAADAHPGRLDIRAKFLETLRPFSFPGVAQLSEEILADVAQNFAEDPQAWELRAQSAWRPIGNSLTGTEQPGHFQAAIAIYEEAVQHLGTQGMYALYTAFLQNILNASSPAAGHAGAVQAPELSQAATVADLLCSVYHQAANKGAMSEQMLLEWAALEMQQGRVEAATAATMRGCQLLPASCGLWQRRLALLAQSAAAQVARAGSKTERKLARQSLQQAAVQGVRSVPAPASAPLWLQLFPAFQALSLPCLPLADQLLAQLTGLAKGHPEGAMGEAAAAAVQAVWTQEGPEAGRQLYQRMLVLPPPGLAFFNRMIDLESAVEASCPSKAGSDRICRIFEAAVDAYGSTNVHLWIRYIAHLQQAAQGSDIMDDHGDTDGEEKNYSLLLTRHAGRGSS
ncbi:hypothetical protein WJX84_006213 [Apatococcus fuscideae]|uniref:U3 small nucleolar RNA-associated protein 6 n=1 Tax=Apatococcus fuscideae TaxID=2026836 RepID=A0AAW1TGP5_9CHLO